MKLDGWYWPGSNTGNQEVAGANEYSGRMRLHMEGYFGLVMYVPSAHMWADLREAVPGWSTPQLRGQAETLKSPGKENAA